MSFVMASRLVHDENQWVRYKFAIKAGEIDMAEFESLDACGMTIGRDLTLSKYYGLSGDQMVHGHTPNCFLICRKCLTLATGKRPCFFLASCYLTGPCAASRGGDDTTRSPSSKDGVDDSTKAFLNAFVCCQASNLLCSRSDFHKKQHLIMLSFSNVL